MGPGEAKGSQKPTAQDLRQARRRPKTVVAGVAQCPAGLASQMPGVQPGWPLGCPCGCLIGSEQLPPRNDSSRLGSKEGQGL